MKYLSIILGVVLALTAVFANQLGIDNDAGWGGGRTLILKTGITLIVLGLFLHVFRHSIHKLQLKISEFLNAIRRERFIWIIFVAATILVVSSYLWFLKIGERDTDRAYNYYSELAKGFRQGHLYLDETPSAALLSLSNPYDPNLRKGEDIEDFPWDISLYKGRFYIYWGPSPALFLLPFNHDVLSRIEDFHLSFFFASGLFIYAASILVSFWRKLKNAPIWALAVALLVISLSVPVTTMLKRGEVYEAAIFACQFFFIGGCYWALSSFENKTPAAWKFVLAGIHWALAIGTRVTILPAVAFTTLMMVMPIFSLDWKTRLRLVLAAGIPLLAGGAALAWYNYVRFGSIFEFGVRYQLANVDYTRFEGSFGLKYLAENLKIYFFYPLAFESRYPFISLVEYPPSNDRLSGLLYVAPFLVLVILPFFRLIVRKTEMNVKALSLFTGATAISAFIVFIFYFVTLRYTLDFIPSALISIALAFAMEYESMKENRFASGMISLVFGFLALANITIGFLLATPKSGIDFMLNLLNAISKVLGLR